ncbi:WD repeat protein [Tolypocladium paradoxum]|uniref:WD repeat protein n=1 Tax=Tolypocladium paradoxum TaxID=94208 RepID=A0A2S4KZZ1_9HYPO|nr:WD repeat protein [Tolypocladium paradoxum]
MRQARVLGGGARTDVSQATPDSLGRRFPIQPPNVVGPPGLFPLHCNSSTTTHSASNDPAMAKKARQRISYVLENAKSSAGGHRLGVNGLAVDASNGIL